MVAVEFVEAGHDVSFGGGDRGRGDRGRGEQGVTGAGLIWGRDDRGRGENRGRNEYRERGVCGGDGA